MVLIKIVGALLALATVVSCGKYHAPGYSYAKFSGPVSGPEKQVLYDDSEGHGHVADYVSKPDYHFAYGVEDPKSKVSQSRKESRLGDVVTGEYSVVDPNGVLRVVKYTADKVNGFQAQVITSGGNDEGGEGHEQSAPVYLEHNTNESNEAEGESESGEDYY